MTSFSKHKTRHSSLFPAIFAVKLCATPLQLKNLDPHTTHQEFGICVSPPRNSCSGESSMSLGGDCPLVSGVSPKEGLPGTKVIIRGENLGSRKEDIETVTICGGDCTGTVEYVSSKKLICYTPNVAAGQGDIIVTTFSGGLGRCTVTFTALEPERTGLLDPLEESDVWVEEDFDSLARVFSDKTVSPVYTRDLRDPLGRSHASRKVRAGSETLGDLFPNESASLMDKNFHPVRHLLERHRYTNFCDLKLGLENLKHEVDRNDLAPIQFMRDNLDAFLQCYDTLSDVNTCLLKDESESPGGTITDRSEELLRESSDRAKKVFDGILKSKVRADGTRNALTVLQRYRFLFSLPKNIEKNIKNHEYDLVATDYEKAKSLFSNTKVKIFKRVLEEVEKQIAHFREDLKHQLLVLPSTLDQQKRLIKYLLELDCDGDPAWDCISNMFLWVLRLLYTSKEDLQFPDNVRAHRELAALPSSLAPPTQEPVAPFLPPRTRSMGEGHSRTISDVSYASTSSYGSQVTASPQRVGSPAIKLSGAGGMPALKGFGRGGGGGGRRGDSSGPPNRILFVEEVTELFSMTLLDLWKLGQAYLNRNLFQGVALLAESQEQLALKCESNKVKFESKLIEVIEIYTNMVNCALFPDAADSLTDNMAEVLGEWSAFDDDTLELSGVWLPQTVRRVRECVHSLEGVGLPEKGMNMLHNLAMNVRSLCADTLFQRAARDIKVLHEREDWKVHNEEGGIVTSLPVVFENRVVDVLLTLKEIVNETYEDSQPEVNQELRGMAKEHFSVLLEHFLASIDCLAFHSEEEASTETAGSTGDLGDQSASQDNPLSASAICEDKHLLILLSNMNYMLAEVVPRIFTCFVSQGYPSAMDLQDRMITDVSNLEDRIFQAYIGRKSESLNGIIQHGMQVGYFDWNQAAEPTKVRSYVREILMNLVIIHAEVYAVSALIVPRVMNELVDILSREFYECIGEVEAFNVNGVVCGFVELTALEDILGPYLTDVSRKNFELARKHLGSWDIVGNERVEEIVKKFKANTRFQLKCFQVQAAETAAAAVEEEDSPAA